MVWIRIAALLLLSVVSFNSAFQLPTKANGQSVLGFLDKMEETIVGEIRNFTSTGYRSPLFDFWTKSVPFDLDMTRLEVEEYPPESRVIGCLACRTYLTTLLRDRREGAPIQQIADSAINICLLLMPFEPQVCRGLINLNILPLMHIIDNRPTLNAVQVCGLILQGECGALDPMFNFNVNVNPHPVIVAPKSVSAPRQPDELRIIHLTDIHYDENYLNGGLADCVNTVCCRRVDGVPPNPAQRSGPWGDYRSCNTPWIAFEETLRRIRAAHPQIDIIYHTGDIMDHGIWETTEAGNRRVMGRVFDLFRQIFPNVPVYHAIGNHEAHPTNIFSPQTIANPSLSTRWLYDFLATSWQGHGWIPASAASTIRIGGYYTVLMRPGLRLIALNNNDCYIYNWWVMYTRTEIQSAMQWLHDTLLAAERSNERVHILAHIPTGSGSCFSFWSRQYRRIVDRFHMTIGAQFNGHSHRDQFEVYYDVNSATHAVNVAWNAGSVTAFTNVNPNYKLYHVDRTFYQVNEAESFVYSISEANRNPAQTPRWFRQYSLREAFGVTNLSPAGLDQLAFNMSRNRNLNRRFYEYRVKAGDPLMQQGCNDECLRNQVCGIVTNEPGDVRRCNQILSVFGTVA